MDRVENFSIDWKETKLAIVIPTQDGWRLTMKESFLPMWALWMASFKSPTPTIVAFTGVNNAHGPSPQPTACSMQDLCLNIENCSALSTKVPLLYYGIFLGSGCCSVGRAVTSQHQRSALRLQSSANFVYTEHLFTFNSILKTKIKKKRLGMAHFQKLI